MTKPVLHWPFPARRLTERGTELHFKADANQLKALAETYDLISAERLEAQITIRSWRGKDGLKLAGHLDAEVTQSCVVTLDPVAGAIHSDFSRRYSRR